MSNSKLQPLSLSSNSITTFEEWSRWKRSLQYYLTAKDITDPERKKAILLHKGGPDLQEVFASVAPVSSDSDSAELDPAALAKKTEKAAVDVFAVVVKLLDAHFKPSVNKFYERHVFRQLRQGEDSLDQFVVKLRRQVPHCSFADAEEAIVDQIIEGTSNPEFRRKILSQRLEKLADIVQLGKLLEAVRVQSTAMDEQQHPTPESVAKLESNSRAEGKPPAPS